MARLKPCPSQACATAALVLLLLVLFYVYPLKFVFTLAFSQLTGGELGRDIGWHEGTVLMQLYSIGFASVFALFTFMYVHAYRLRTKLELKAIELHKTRVSIQQNVLLVAIGVASFALAFREPMWAGFLYLAVGPLLGIHGFIARRRRRRLVAE